MRTLTTAVQMDNGKKYLFITEQNDDLAVNVEIWVTDNDFKKDYRGDCYTVLLKGSMSLMTTKQMHENVRAKAIKAGNKINVEYSSNLNMRMDKQTWDDINKIEKYSEN